MEFEEVDYWEELKAVMDWSVTNVFSTFHICWGAQAGLYHHYGIKKYPLEKKMFGVFPHTVNENMLNCSGALTMFSMCHNPGIRRSEERISKKWKT